MKSHLVASRGRVSFRALTQLLRAPAGRLGGGLRRGLVSLALLATPASFVAADEPGRLFYTPAQRTQLEQARVRNITQRATPAAATPQPRADRPPAQLRYDGIVIRSDGQSTRWVDGKAEVGASSVPGLKPGQVRSNGKIYEPYQLLRPQPSGPAGGAAPEAAP